MIPAGALVTVPVPEPTSLTLSTKTPGIGANCAVTDFAALIVTAQTPVPVQAPLQPLNSEPLAALAVRVTSAPWSKLAAQVVPQVIPAGELVTVPVPVPLVATESRCCSRAKVAVTSFAALIVTLHSLAPVTSPQPVQTTGLVLAPELAVRVTTVPSAKLASQLLPQLIPAGALVTVPVPEPDLATLSPNCPGTGANSAPTALAALIVTLHSLAPTISSQPLQTTGSVFGAGAADQGHRGAVSEARRAGGPAVDPGRGAGHRAGAAAALGHREQVLFEREGRGDFLRGGHRHFAFVGAGDFAATGPDDRPAVGAGDSAEGDHGRFVEARLRSCRRS